MNSFFTLSQLQTSIKRSLGENFSTPIWVSAEIGEINVNANSGHCYMELIEKADRGNGYKARIAATIWRNVYGMLRSLFVGSTGMELTCGMKVLVKGVVAYHEVYGLSLQIVDIDPAYTLGEQALRRQQTIDQLKSEGVFDMNRTLSEPLIALRIAVVSSAGAAGWGDFSNEMARSRYNFSIELFEAVVQGDKAEESIANALDMIAERCDSFDAVAILRGGGSQSDLNCFDSYLLCSAIAQFPIPIYTGIGHQRDQSVADLVAYKSLKTPTALAQYFVERVGAFELSIDQAAENLKLLTRRLIDNNAMRLTLKSEELRSSSAELMHRLELMFVNFEHRASKAVRDVTTEQKSRLERCSMMINMAARNTIERQKSRLDNAQAVVEGNRVERILSLGFAIVRHDGRAVRNGEELTSGTKVEITMERGSKTATID